MHTQPNQGVRTSDIQQLQIREQVEALKVCYHAHTVDGQCIGWLPRAVYNARYRDNQIVTVHNNDDLVGYTMWADSGKVTKLFVTWVRQDARLILHGRALIDHIESRARRRGMQMLSLWCATDLAANYFWSALGFTKVTWRWGRAKKGRRHWLWRRQVGTTLPHQAHHTPSDTALVLPAR